MAGKSGRKPAKAGRPEEGRVRMTVHVLPATADSINSLVDKTNSARNSQGKIIDEKFPPKTGVGKGSQSSSE
jgi:hypothetical protein